MKQKKRYVFIIMSGLGYLYPAIRLSIILQKKNHQVLFVSTQEHSITLANYGIDHFPVNNSHRRFLDLHGWGIPSNALINIDIVDKVIDKFRPDVIVTNPFAMISFILAEKYQLPLLNIGFCEYLFTSTDDKHTRINEFTEIYNSCRSLLGLPHVEFSKTNSVLLGTKYLLRNVEKLYDNVLLPSQVEFVGGLYLEPSYINQPLLHFIASSKKSNKRIGYIQIGRLFKDVDVWENLLFSLSHTSMNFIVDIGNADYSIKESWKYSNFFTSSFIPIGAIKDDIDFVICGGQTTSVISAIIHGKKILGVPRSDLSIQLINRLENNKLALGIYQAEKITIGNINDIIVKFSNDSLNSAISEYQNIFLSYSDDVVYNKIKSI